MPWQQAVWVVAARSATVSCVYSMFIYVYIYICCVYVLCAGVKHSNSLLQVEERSPVPALRKVSIDGQITYIYMCRYE